MKKGSEIISAQVVLKIGKGKSFGNKPITARNIKSIMPGKVQLDQVSTILAKAGFTVEPSETSISVRGEKVLFEKYFNVQLPSEAIKTGNTPDIVFQLPIELKDLIDNVVLSRPAELF